MSDRREREITLVVARGTHSRSISERMSSSAAMSSIVGAPSLLRILNRLSACNTSLMQSRSCAIPREPSSPCCPFLLVVERGWWMASAEKK